MNVKSCARVVVVAMVLSSSTQAYGVVRAASGFLRKAVAATRSLLQRRSHRKLLEEHEKMQRYLLEMRASELEDYLNYWKKEVEELHSTLPQPPFAHRSFIEAEQNVARCEAALHEVVVCKLNDSPVLRERFLDGYYRGDDFMEQARKAKK